MKTNRIIKIALKQALYPKIVLPLLIIAISLTGGCQSIQPYNGKTGYQRESSNPGQVIISYTLDSKTTDEIASQKLQKACAKELGLTVNTPVKFNILDQKEFANFDQQTSFNHNGDYGTVQLGNSERTSFGLSATPKLSNSSNTAGIDMLSASPGSLKQITAVCLR